MKKILAFIVALILCVPMFGCNQKMQIKIACDEYLIDSLCVTRAVDYFESHSNTEVTLVEYSKDLLSDSTVDALIHPLDADMIELGMSDNFYDFSSSAWVNDIQEYCYDSVIYDERVYGFPFGTANITGCFFNRKLFEQHGIEIPVTQKEFENVCNKLLELGITPLYVAGGDVWPVAFQFGLEKILARRPAYAEELSNRDVSMAEIPGVSLMLDWWKIGSDKGWFGKDWHNAKFDAAASVLGEGKAAMIITSDDWINTGLGSNYTFKSTDFDIMPVFMGVDTEGFIGGSQIPMISVKKNSNKAGVVLDMVEMLSDPEVYNLCYSGVSTIPIHSSQMGIVTSQQFDTLNPYDIGSMSAFYPRISGFNQVHGAKVIMDYTKGKISLEECLEEIGNAK